MLSGKNIQDVYPLSPMQEGMLFHHLYDPSSAAYFLQVAYRLKGNLVMSYVEKTLNELVKRHDILRTVFNYKRKKDKLLQVVLREATIDWQCLDARQLTTIQDKDKFIEDFKQSDKRRSF